MKLLEWIHHKLQHSTKETYKDLTVGSSCICLSAQPSHEDPDCYKGTNFGSRHRYTSSNALEKKQEESLSSFEAKKESTIDLELFHGFLTIGTLGSEPKIRNAPETPSFGTPLESITDGKTEVTQDELKLLNYELEKFLEVESKEAGYNESSARHSYVSIITLNGNQMEEGTEEETNQKTVVCPLQGYLLGSGIELLKTKTDMKKERASLADLFHSTKITEIRETEEVQTKPKHTSAMYFVRKMIKRVHASSKRSAPSSGGVTTDFLSTKKEKSATADSIPSKKKLPKVFRMFNRKIHPERSEAATVSAVLKKGMVKKTPKDGCTNENSMQLNGENRRFSTKSASKEGMQYYKSNMNLPQYRQSNNFGDKGEHWIKTDADYLVLEF